jgi:hypothetical protein
LPLADSTYSDSEVFASVSSNVVANMTQASLVTVWFPTTV